MKCNHVTFYIMKLVSDDLYVMLEIAHIQVPSSLYELVSYLSHLGDLLNVVQAFYDECGDANTSEERAMVEIRQRATIMTPEVIRVVELIRSNKRPCNTAYYY
ncbi:hypothetical protein BCR42DRAFT_444728 [Absidia repens]|uniref:Uncharacterized protein n=1 Tax=Absidia repens TaxID=90262 RepID=A0A1X2HDY4_9FUNG|nr:hypothetical protein BCR42DRAFT_444728 [Absidia repens]